MTQMNNLQKDIQEWAHKTFEYNGTPSTIASLHHLSDEVEELRKAVMGGDITEISEEYADCFIILLHTALSHGLTFDDIIVAVKSKMEENKSRQWGNPDERGVVNHVKK